MLTDSPHTPPWILLLLSAMATSKSWEEHRKRIRELLPELRTQCEAFERDNVRRADDDRGSGRFEVHLHGALDLFSGAGCSVPACRILAADQLARSFGLIADRVWLTDTLSGRFLDFGRATNKKLDEVVLDCIVVSRLLPLIEAGVVRFRSPWIATCSSCSAEFEREVEFATMAVRRVFRREFRIKDLGEGNYVASTGRSYDPPLVYRALRKPGVAIPTAREFADGEVSDCIRTTLWAAREASRTNGTIATNSRIGLAGLLQVEGRLVESRDVFLLEREREIRVPWVSELNASQILQLREEASHALPAFRSAIGGALSSNVTAKEPGAAHARDVIAGLRDQALQVRAELAAKRRHAGRLWRTAYSLLGLGVSAYGVAFDQAAAGVAGLLPVIQLLIEHKSGHEASVAQLESRPGYVLVRASEILAHAHTAGRS